MSRPITLIYHGTNDSGPFTEEIDAHVLTDTIVWHRDGNEITFREVATISEDATEVNVSEDDHKRLYLAILNYPYGAEMAKKLTGEQLATATFAEVVASLMR